MHGHLNVKFSMETHHISPHVQYSVPEDKHKMFAKGRRQEDLN